MIATARPVKDHTASTVLFLIIALLTLIYMKLSRTNAEG